MSILNNLLLEGLSNFKDNKGVFLIHRTRLRKANLKRID